MDSKFIVFFRHKAVREAIEKKLVTMKVKYICIAGHVASAIRGVCLPLMYSVCTSYGVLPSDKQVPWSSNVPFS